MAEGNRQVDVIAIPTSVFFSAQNSPFLELGNDPLDGALRDSHLAGDVAKTHLGVPQQADQDMGVIREERPTNVGQSRAQS